VIVRRAVPRVAAEIRLTLLAVWRGVEGVARGNDLTFASSIAYYALLSLFPFFLIAFSILGSVTANPNESAAVFNFVLRYFPRQFEFVTTQLASMQEARVRLGVAGSLLMIWASMGVFGAITTAVNHAWGVDRQPSYLKHKLISFIMLVAASLLLLAGLLLVSAINLFDARWFSVVAQEHLHLLEVLQHFAVQWASTALFIAVVGLIYYYVPNATVRFRDVWVGAVLTGLLWRGALWGFSLYLRINMSRLNHIHGSIAAVVVFLVWIYTTAVLLLYGVEVTAAIARLRRHRPEEIPAAPTPRT
jgi:membrane protein